MKQLLILEEMGESKVIVQSLKENYKNLIQFVSRMNRVLKNINAEVAHLKETKEHAFDQATPLVAPEPAKHIQWKATEEVIQALERFKQREAVLLDSKIRYKREDKYRKETRSVR